MPLFKKLGPVFEVELSAIVGWQHGPDRNKLERYRRALRKGAKFPPIDVIHTGFENGDWDIVDGVHRYHAHRLEGRETIRCRMRRPG
jgi:ParB-like chromosome segregation protein Spo0J